MAFKEVSVSGWSLGSYWAPIISPSGSSGIFNVVFCVVPDLREASKGEEVTVGVALIASAIVSPFQGILNGTFE